MDTYHCDWCGWNGYRIEEQIAARTTTSVHYVCWVCGMAVKPSAHSEDVGWGNREEEGGGPA